MPHNPRRTRDRDSVPIVLTDEQIAEAMRRAQELRRRATASGDAARPAAR